MIVLSLSEEDCEHISSLLEREGAAISRMKEQGTLSPDVSDRLIRKNSGAQAIFKVRMVPYICVLREISTGDIYHFSFQEFEKYFGSFPEGLNEAQIMNHISDWCCNYGYSVEFKRES